MPLVAKDEWRGSVKTGNKFCAEPQRFLRPTLSVATLTHGCNAIGCSDEYKLS
jgi:hypothetical protein